VGLVGRPVDIHISLIRSHRKWVGWRRLEGGKGRTRKMLKDIGLQFNGGISMMAMSGNTMLTA
jgi:hypothetical protein